MGVQQQCRDNLAEVDKTIKESSVWTFLFLSGDQSKEVMDHAVWLVFRAD